ncbi:MAG: rod shape-determining protein [Alicyclobacillus herbarius]|uniref:rod shape-determining protein n=1 Tax=Alicyclobacillus herbarius TaxID=122960 RepID=UPI002354112F|nr:rod shape-determining protein [Alicyclobacillus herbarius]MCL6633284.1 rod shape-determining protein [Alicyclobacillus herbarius]
MNLAIDIGTCGFRAGVVTRSDLLNEPSVVAYGQASGPVVGRLAEQMIGRHPGHIRISFPIEGSIVRDFDALVDVFKYIVATALPGRLRKRFDLVLAHSSHQSQVDRKAFDEAAKAAGARRVQFVEATLAAARGAGLPIDQPIGSLIVDLGGGTTEVALLSLGGVVEQRSLNVGGRAIDQELVDKVQRHFAFAIGLRTAEVLKQWACQDPDPMPALAETATATESTSSESSEVPHASGAESGQATFKVRGRNLTNGLPDSLEIPLGFVREILDQYAEQVIGLIRDTMEACPPELVGDVMDRGIVLVGGGARMNRFLDILRQRIDVPVAADAEPDTCVIRGLLQHGR